MIYFLSHIRDTIGNNYLGIKIPDGITQPFLNELKDLIGDSDYEEFTSYQKRRDHGSYHMTVINVMDYNRLSKEMGVDKFINSLEPIFKYEIDDIKMMGLGTAERNGNRAYFIVCESEKLDAIRTRFNLPKHDFHITLGFRHKDVFGIPKNEVIKKEGKFLKLLKQEFYKSDNWNFIKRIGNFELDTKAEIIPISISNNSMKFKCQDYYMDIGWLEDGGKFWIMTKYPVDEDLPRLSETEIAKILNKNKYE
jgi:hypothetical protein